MHLRKEKIKSHIISLSVSSADKILKIFIILHYFLHKDIIPENLFIIRFSFHKMIPIHDT